MTIYTVCLLPSNIQFEVKQGQTVLEAALNQQITLPHRCQVGMCTACLCRKIEGEVSYLLAPILSEKEQAQGWVFPCQAFPQSHLVLSFME